MNEIFGRDYADVYDAFYKTKDYKREVDLIERILREEGAGGPRTLLDLGCGTGNHALPLAQRGHTVVGVDQSEAMIARAREKSAGLPEASRLEFRQGDIRDVDLHRRFDAVVMMFTVLGYMHDRGDVDLALRTARRHLGPGGLFIFDIWNGLAVVADKPRPREVAVEDQSAKIVRKTRVQLDQANHICRVYFDLTRAETDGTSKAWSEEHVMRFFFPEELEQALVANGFTPIKLRSFPDYEGPPDERAWNVIVVARAG